MGRKTKAIRKAIFTDWKTTLTSLVAAGAMGYVGYTTANPALILAAAGILTGGVVSKDSNK